MVYRKLEKYLWYSVWAAQGRGPWVFGSLFGYPPTDKGPGAIIGETLILLIFLVPLLRPRRQKVQAGLGEVRCHCGISVL